MDDGARQGLHVNPLLDPLPSAVGAIAPLVDEHCFEKERMAKVTNDAGGH